MTKKLSIITSGLLLSTSMAFAADSIDEAFKGGKVSGSLDAYYSSTDTEGAADSAYASTGVSFAFETDSYMGLTGKIGVVAASDIYEKEDGDSSDLADNAILSEANITFTTEGLSLTAGRQAVGLEWIGDYHEAVSASVTAIPNTTLTLLYTDKSAVAGVDEISSEFADVNGTKGAYVADAMISPVEGIDLNPYFYSIPDVADFYGMKASYSADMISASAQYAASSEDVSATDDGSILALDIGTEIEGLSLTAGYIKTDKDCGIGSIANLGDSISPFDNGATTYGTDAKTVYGSLGYSIAGVDLGLLYGETKYESDYKEKELNVSLGYAITETLSASLLYAKVNLDEDGEATKAAADQGEDNSYVTASLSYAF
jgi:hypothetical protein